MAGPGVLLLGGPAFAGGVQSVQHFDLGWREGVGGGLLTAVARLYQLQDDAGALGGDYGHFHQSLGSFDLAVLKPQSVRFHQPEQLLDGPPLSVPVHDPPRQDLIVERVRRQ